VDEQQSDDNNNTKKKRMMKEQGSKMTPTGSVTAADYCMEPVMCDSPTASIATTTTATVRSKETNDKDFYYYSTSSCSDTESTTSNGSRSNRNYSNNHNNHNHKKSAHHSTGQQRKNKGMWTLEEHEQFLLGYSMYGNDWKRISNEFVKTRSRSQLASHAQKYFCKQKRVDHMNDHEKLSMESKTRSLFFQ